MHYAAGFPSRSIESFQRRFKNELVVIGNAIMASSTNPDDVIFNPEIVIKRRSGLVENGLQRTLAN
ncbi:MAG TPA: hypothetical protein VG733_00930 [Chthoniobacteraceae bacterium]|nr:hypothetical protein [Chthoniobacteraceae bacterium]